MIKPKMVEATGCRTRRSQGQETTITIGTTFTIGIIIETTITVRIITIIIGLTISIRSRCCVTMTPGHAGCLPPRKTRPTDMDELIMCFSLTLEPEEYQTIV
jgi:hypothetical protein